MLAIAWMGILPHLILSGTSIVIMMVLSFCRNLLLTTTLTLLGLLGALFSICFIDSGAFPIEITTLLSVDSFSLFFTRLILIATFFITLLAYNYFRPLNKLEGLEREERPEEFFILLTISTLGAIVMVCAQHFVSFFLGLELLSIPLYAMVAYYRERERSLEAGLKYLILAGAAGAFLLFGMALIYAELGTMHFPAITLKLTPFPTPVPLLLILGTCFIIISVGFKLSAAPFHMWAPDVYEGAPAPIAAYVASVSKGAIMALFIRFFYSMGGFNFQLLTLIITVVAITSMFMGNFLALKQKNIKRLLAYSSTAHIGYILTGLVVGGNSGANIEAIMFYLVAYFITTIAGFGIIAALTDKGRELETVEEYQGLFWVHPGVSCVFMAVLFSLIGIPLTAGFIGKYLIVASGVQVNQWPLMAVLILNSFIGLYYYLRVTVSLFHKEHHGHENETGQVVEVPEVKVHKHRVQLLNGLVLTTLLIALLWMGLYPTTLLDFIHTSVIKLTTN